MNDQSTPNPIDAANAPFILQEMPRDDAERVFDLAKHFYTTTGLSLNASFAEAIRAFYAELEDNRYNNLNEGILG